MQAGYELVIGWANTIKIGLVHWEEVRTSAAQLFSYANNEGMQGGAVRAGPTYLEVVTFIQTDFFICGLAGVQMRLEARQLQRDLLVLTCNYEQVQV